jgi:hypothetical protein
MIPAQIPLTDDSSCEGGQLMFACSDGQLMYVQRRVGGIMAHDGDALRGATVTRLVKGVRCGVAVRHAVTKTADATNSCVAITEQPQVILLLSVTRALPLRRYGLTGCMLLAGDSRPPCPLHRASQRLAESLNQNSCR